MIVWLIVSYESKGNQLLVELPAKGQAISPDLGGMI
jgi:hypothetical protein